MCNHFNNLVNTIKKEETIETGENIHWLDNTDERKHMSDREILEKYIDLSNSCLHKEGKGGSYGYVIHNIRKYLV